MKKLLTLLFCLANFGAAHAQTDSPNDDALIWEISGNGLKQPSYLMGTMHPQCGKILSHITGFYRVFNAVQQVALESDFQKEREKSKAKKTPTEAETLMPKDTTYQMLLGDSLYNKLLTLFGGNDSFLELRPDKLKLGFEYGIESIAGDHFIFNVENGIKYTDYYPIRLDQYIDSLARDKGLEVIGLEVYDEVFPEDTVPKSMKEEAMGLFDEFYLQRLCLPFFLKADTIYYNQTPSLYQSISDEYINQMVQNPPIDLKLFKKGKYSEVKKYSGAEKDSLIRQLTEEFFGDGKDMQERNENWMKKIPQLIAAKPTLIAVGLAHLVEYDADKGLIARLREMGYTLKPVKE